MAEKGHEGQFPPPSLNDRCRLGEATFAGMGDDELNAPKAPLAVMLVPRAEIDPIETFAVDTTGRSMPLNGIATETGQRSQGVRPCSRTSPFHGRGGRVLLTRS
jgi:hypothetical protein